MLPRIIFALGVNLIYLCQSVLGYPFQASDTECVDMIPRSLGGVTPNTKPRVPPFYFEISHTMYDYRGALIVHLKSSHSNYDIRGLFLQARVGDCDAGEYRNKPVGRFEINPGEHHLKLVNCTSQTHSAVVNANFMPFSHISVKWYSPSGNVGPVYFKATVVHNKDRYWKDIHSEMVRPLGTKYRGRICSQKQEQTQGNGASSRIPNICVIGLTLITMVLSSLRMR